MSQWISVRDKLPEPITNAQVEAASAEPPKYDACSICHGAEGGVPGNEQIVNGVTICDYCHAKQIAIPPHAVSGDDVLAKVAINCTESSLADMRMVAEALYEAGMEIKAASLAGSPQPWIDAMEKLRAEDVAKLHAQLDKDRLLIEEHLNTIAALRDENDRLKALCEWTPITETNLPKVDDEVGRGFSRSKGWFTQIVHGTQQGKTAKDWTRLGWTHRRSLNRPAQPTGEKP